MKKNKNNEIINSQKNNKSKIVGFISIMIIFVIIIILMIAILVNNKIMFFKCLGETFGNKNGLIENRLKQYYEKKEKTPYENEGGLVGDFILNVDGKKFLSHPNNGIFGITFNGKTDKVKDIKDGEIILNYGNNISWPIKYKKTDEFIGIQSDYLAKQYLVTTNQEFEKMLEGTSESLLNSNLKTNIKPVDILEKISKGIEVKDEIKECFKSISKDKFTQIEKDKYKVILDTSDIERIVEGFQIDINKLSYSSLNAEIIVSKSTEINVKINMTIINNGSPTNINMTANIVKQSQKDNLTYNLSIKAILNKAEKQIVDYTANLNMEFSGLESMNEICEKHLLNYDLIVGTGELKSQAEFNNNIKFVDNIQDPNFTDEEKQNILIYQDEQLTQDAIQLKNKIEQTNNELLEKSEIPKKFESLSLVGLELFEKGTSKKQF